MMDCLKNFETKSPRGRRHRFIPIVLEVGNSASETRKWGTCTLARWLTYPFLRSIRDAFLDQGLAEEHHWVRNSGWITFRVRSEDDLKHTLGLMRLSHLRYALKTASDSRGLLEPETEDLHLNPRFRSLLEPFMRKTAKVSTGPFPA